MGGSKLECNVRFPWGGVCVDPSPVSGFSPPTVSTPFKDLSPGDQPVPTKEEREVTCSGGEGRKEGALCFQSTRVDWRAHHRSSLQDVGRVPSGKTWDWIFLPS